MCIDMASILFAVVMCFTAGFAAPLHQGPHTLNLELALFDASLHLGDIRAYVAEWDKSHVRAAVVGDLFAGDGHLYEAAMDRGYQSWKYDMIYDPIVQNILTKRPKLNKEFQGSRWALKCTVRPLGAWLDDFKLEFQHFTTLLPYARPVLATPVITFTELPEDELWEGAFSMLCTW
jgi:hypothetical protein